MSPSRREIIVRETADHLRRIFQVLQSHSKRMKLETGIPGPQLWALAILSESPPMTLSDLSRRMYLHPSTVVGVVDRLEARGYVSRRRTSKDRRVVSLELTPEGREAVSRAPAGSPSLVMSVLESLSEEDLKDVRHGIAVLVKVLEAAQSPPPFEETEPEDPAS